MKNINTYFFDNNSNFGDALNREILLKLFDINPIPVQPNKAQLVCIGSVLDSFLHGSSDLKLFVKKIMYPKVHVWGTGFIDQENSRVKRSDNKHETFTKKTQIHALRGKLTLKRVEKILNKDLSEIVLGDPGLLASKLISQTEVRKKYRVGIIPHYVDANNPLIASLANTFNDSTIINILDPIDKILTEIAECEFILSSAMHGLIGADSLGVPNARIIVSDKITGGDYKFNDYYSVFNLKTHQKFDLRNSKNFHLQDIQNEYNIKLEDVQAVQRKLLNSIPLF